MSSCICGGGFSSFNKSQFNFNVFFYWNAPANIKIDGNTVETTVPHVPFAKQFLMEMKTRANLY